MERIDDAKSLVAMYQSPPSSASMDNPLCDVVHTKSGPRPVFPSKTSVGSELAKLCNWLSQKRRAQPPSGRRVGRILTAIGGKANFPAMCFRLFQLPRDRPESGRWRAAGSRLSGNSLVTVGIGL